MDFNSGSLSDMENFTNNNGLTSVENFAPFKGTSDENGHYSLFSGYNKSVGPSNGFSLNEVAQTAQRAISSVFSGESEGGSEGGYKKSHIVVNNDSSPRGSFRTISTTSSTKSGKSVTNINVLIKIASKNIRKLHEKGAKLLRKVKKTSDINKVLRSVKNRINKIQVLADREIAKIRSNTAREAMMKAQELIKRVQKTVYL